MLPNHFLTASPTIATFDWIDLANGSGYARFYLVGQEINTGDLYTLTSEALPNDDGNTSTGSLGTATNETNWDMTINKPIIVAAAPANVLFFMSSTAAGVSSCYMVVTVYHVSVGAVETSLGTATSRTVSGESLNSQINLPISLTTKSFAIGEKIRISMEFHSTNNFNSWRWGGTGSYPAYIDIPFRIDL